jgi:hypothetical protein
MFGNPRNYSNGSRARRLHNILERWFFTMQWTKEELIKLWTNNDKRKEFLKNYEEWGVWLTVAELGLTYYQYTLPDDSGRILAMAYKRPNPYTRSDEDALQTAVIYYVWEGEHFIPSPASEYEIVDRLKKLKAAMQAEIRTESSE